MEMVTREESRDTPRENHRPRDQHRVLGRRKGSPPGLRIRESQNNSNRIIEETTTCLNPRPPKEKREHSRTAVVKLPPIRGATRAPSAKRPPRLPSARAPSAKHAKMNILFPESTSPCDDEEEQQSEREAQLEITRLLYPAMVNAPKVPKPPPKVPRPPQGKPPAVRSRRDMSRQRPGASQPQDQRMEDMLLHRQKMALRMAQSEAELRRQLKELEVRERNLIKQQNMTCHS